MMPANFSIILNVVLLVGVAIAIRALFKGKREQAEVRRAEQAKWARKPAFDAGAASDDILSVRKVSTPISQQVPKESFADAYHVADPVDLPTEDEPNEVVIREVVSQRQSDTEAPAQVMMFLLAKEGRKIAGYELLQTLLTAGLRFGEGDLFHRHQFSNGKGPVLFSLAAATPTGTFDLQNMGAFSVHGLCLFLQTSHNPTIDTERFEVMLETARQLSEDLDAHWLDDARQPFSQDSERRIRRLLGMADVVCDEVV